jgi:hypothetical protein
VKLDRKLLGDALGPDLSVKGEAWHVWLWIMFQGQRIAHLNIADGTLDSWLLIKWKSRPEGWKPFEVDLGGEELLDAELRPQWEARGFAVEHEGISSCWYPDGDPLASYPAVEVSMSLRAKGVQEAVAAIQFIASEKRDVWADV